MNRRQTTEDETMITHHVMTYSETWTNPVCSWIGVTPCVSPEKVARLAAHYSEHGWTGGAVVLMYDPNNYAMRVVRDEERVIAARRARLPKIQVVALPADAPIDSMMSDAGLLSTLGHLADDTSLPDHERGCYRAAVTALRTDDPAITATA